MTPQKYQFCLDACNACATACESCAASCLVEDNVKMMASCIALDMDCSRICSVAAGFLARGSLFAQHVCKLCADICHACALECGRHDAPHCQECAEACHRCAKECLAIFTD